MLQAVIDQLPGFWLLVTASLIVFVAANLQIATGMGFGMIAAPLLVLLDPLFAPAPILMVGLFLASAGAWPERKNIVPWEMVAGIGGRIIGSMIAIGLLLIFADEKSFYLLFGSLTLTAILLRALGLDVAFNKVNHWMLSTVSGLMGTITSVGAPPMAILYQGQSPSKIRPTLNALFLVSCVVGLVSLTLAGRVGLPHLISAACFLPGVVLGERTGRFFKTGDAAILGRVLLLIAGAAALTLIVRGLT